ncbi:hypothetical protein SAMN02745116_01113 [Pilibacter termitis]|uniref:Uncharacterized protein n=1 Tax=Pilibacter termitis TaxID=263852 RepID=A0A1T4MIT4_9ENTE|nr:hypothetical protein [Pilibacter termitis]SJZ66929.1 hypothetical protein SAMN02745116_01113 [Pilibacter termitis]
MDNKVFKPPDTKTQIEENGIDIRLVVSNLQQKKRLFKTVENGKTGIVFSLKENQTKKLHLPKGVPKELGVVELGGKKKESKESSCLKGVM